MISIWQLNLILLRICVLEFGYCGKIWILFKFNNYGILILILFVTYFPLCLFNYFFNLCSLLLYHISYYLLWYFSLILINFPIPNMFFMT